MSKIKRNCPVCWGKENKLIFSDFNRREWYSELTSDYIECNFCKMRYLTNIPDFETFSEKYEDIYMEPNIKELQKRLKTKIKSNWKRVLDVWCNFWIELIKLYNKWYTIYWIDLNRKAIDDCKKYLPKDNFFSTTIEDSKFEKWYLIIMI